MNFLKSKNFKFVDNPFKAHKNLYSFYTGLYKKNYFIIYETHNQNRCIEGIIYVQLSDIEEKYERFQRVRIQRYVGR